MPGINGDFFNKFLTSAQKAKAEEASKQINSEGSIDEIENLLNNNIFNMDFSDSEIQASSDINSLIGGDLKNSEKISDNKISEIVNTLQDYENLLDSIVNGKNYTDENEYSREYNLKSSPNVQSTDNVSDFINIEEEESAIQSEITAGNQIETENKPKEYNSLLKEENYKILNYKNGSVINDEKNNSRSYYNLEGLNTANLGSMDFVITETEVACKADYNGLTSEGKIVKGKLVFDIDEHTGTLDGKPILMDSDTGVVTFQNSDDEEALINGNSGSNTAAPVGVSSLTQTMDRVGNIVTARKSLDDESVSFYSQKGDKIAKTSGRNYLDSSKTSYSEMYTGYDSENNEISGTLVYDANSKGYTLDGKPCEFNEKTGKITFKESEYGKRK